GDDRLFLERFVAEARHIEVQIFGDGKGHVVALGEYVAYESAGTVEFIFDLARDDFYFLEINTRLQVEHPVTETVFGIDLIEWMVRQAAGEDVLSTAHRLTPKGAAIEVRLYAENPGAGFRPSAGLLTEVVFPGKARVDAWIETGTEVTPFYDPMLAKIIVSGTTRAAAIAQLREALATTRIAGIETNLDYLRAITASHIFESGRMAINVLQNFVFLPRTIDVIEPGAQSTIQELPGRLGLWHVGVPPSGPMDALSFRLANRIVANPETMTALEMTARGATLRFNADCTIALAGARMKAALDGTDIFNNVPIAVHRGQTLTLGAVERPGMRTYLAVRGGFDVPVILGSLATFMLGGFGGHATAALTVGDVLHLGQACVTSAKARPATYAMPVLTQRWTLGVLYGPQGAPDFFLEEDIDTFFSAE
ncbi:MAG: urea carboxylase, partial [Gammaproteobacteria bacterium]